VVGSEVAARLQGTCSQAGVNFEVEPGVVSVRPFGVYTIRAVDDGNVATIWAAGWHTHIDEVDQAVACFMWLLTPFYRVVEEWGETSLIRAWTERYDEHGWEQIGDELCSAGSWLKSRLFKRALKRRIYYQAALTGPPSDIKKISPNIKLDDAGMPPGSYIGIREETLGN